MMFILMTRNLHEITQEMRKLFAMQRLGLLKRCLLLVVYFFRWDLLFPFESLWSLVVYQDGNVFVVDPLKGSGVRSHQFLLKENHFQLWTNTKLVQSLYKGREDEIRGSFLEVFYGFLDLKTKRIEAMQREITKCLGGERRLVKRPSMISLGS